MKLKKVKIGTIGVFQVELPYLVVGRGSPKGVIMAVQHGGELSPLWIIKSLLKLAKKIRGTATIVPIANPFGLITGNRNEAIEDKDLNRQFPGNKNGDFSGRLADKIFALCKNSDFVIDLHTFSRQSPFLAGYSLSKNTQVEVKKIISLLKPDVAWVIDEKKGEDKRFSGSLDSALARRGIPSVFIEMPNYQTISPSLIARIADGILNVFSNFTERMPANMIVPEYKAKYLYASTAGLFEPTVPIMKKVTAGQVIGTICELPKFNTKKIITPVSGLVLTLKGKDLIRTGSKIGSIGLDTKQKQ